MLFELTYEREPSVLKVRVTGVQSQAAVDDLVVRVKARAAQEGCQRILVDYREVQVSALSNKDRATIGAHLGMALGADLKVAVVYTAASINQFAIITAASRGAVIKTVDSEEAGRAWLFAH